ncbi:MAG: thioesterase family protein [Candidatus Velthaea sp.]
MEQPRQLAFASFYEADGDVFAPTLATSSPWDDRAQHGGPPTALLAYAVNRNHPREDAIVARATIDFLGTIPRIPLRVRTRIVRPGARVELSEAVLSGIDDGRDYLIGRFWRIRVAEIALPAQAAAEPPPPLPAAQPQRFFHGMRDDWGYGNALELRFVNGSLRDYGPADGWSRVRVPLVAGVPLDPLSRVLVVADSANGISVELPLAEYYSIPPGLSVTLDRYPQGEWVYLNARTRLTAHGVGHTEGWLADGGGRFGLISQPLLIEKR